ncbi:hypothetical protein BDQ17DRAFT_1327905 [Cyathus striatus]|nr:hypothetical protein BDQ17DRAFT_1327905 [Cyathus striatus]
MHNQHNVASHDIAVNEMLFGAVRSEKKSGILTLKVSWISTSAELTQFKLLPPEKKCLYTVADLEGLGIVMQILRSEVGLSCPEWINLLGSMGNVLKITKPIGQIDPHAKLAFSAAKVAFEAYIVMCILKLVPLVDFTVIWFDVDDMIKQFEKQIFTLKEVFFTGIMISIGHFNVRMMERLEELNEKLDELVNELSLPVLGKSWNELYGCLEGTHNLLLSEIYQWGSTCKDEVPNIFLLLGPSTCGKSAIAHTVASFSTDKVILGQQYSLTQKYSHQEIVQQLYIKSFNIYQVAQGFLENYSMIIRIDIHGLKSLNINYPTIVALTPSLNNLESPTSPRKITLLQIQYAIKATSDVQVEAAIYRATTQNGQAMLAWMQTSIENSQIGIKPHNANPNEAGIQVVKDPLTGRASWFIKNIPSTGDKFKSHDILWFDCPISTSNRITQGVFDGTILERRGIRFINSLLPGDCIAIIAKSENNYRIETTITLYTDANEKCSPPN